MSDEHGKVRADVMTSIALGKEKQEDGKASGGWFARDQMTLQCLRTAFANLRVGLDEKIDGLMLRHDIDDDARHGTQPTGRSGPLPRGVSRSRA